jgi:pimeloyl-ACP methyl ester carboxylesterase
VTHPLLFIQGGGAGAHDDWDDKLVDSLRRSLGPGYDIRYPRMPGEDDPSFARWAPAIGKAIAALDDGAVLIGHSIGGTILIHALAEQPPERRIAAILLVSAPFVGAGGWPGDEFALPHDLGARLPPDAAVHLFQGLADETTPPAHAELYRRAIPRAEMHRLPGRNHQLNNDLGEVAEAIKAVG